MSFFRIPVAVGATLLSLSTVFAGGRQDPAAMDAAKARQAIIDLNKMWGKARVAVDTATFDKTLAPDFYVEIDGKKQTRQEFIDEISRTNTQIKIVRFDVNVLTVTKNGDHWDAVIQEKLEGKGKGKDGKENHVYSLWITRDGWKPGPDHWQALYSIAIGYQNWWNEKPPVDHWN